MNHQIADYDLHIEKREVQKMIFPLIKKKKIVTLAGPNMISYIKLLPKCIKEVEIWENNKDIMMHQVASFPALNGMPVSYNYGDIIDAEVKKSAFYDLDFCCTVLTVEDHLRKFKDCAFSATFSNRWVSVDRTIELFLDAVGEKKKLDIPHPQFNRLATNKNVYIYTTHKKTMMTIFKFH
jgi:hypothetical protein